MKQPIVRALIAVAVVSAAALSCSTDSDRDNADVAVDADTGSTTDTHGDDTAPDEDTGEDADVVDPAWETARTEAALSRQTWQELVEEHEGETCVWQQFRSVFGFGWASRASFDGDTMTAWEYCTLDAPSPDSEPDYTCETGSAGETPTFESVASGAFDPMSALYATCIDDLLQRDPSVWETPVFETDGAGVLYRCGVTQRGCVDDCTDGIVVRKFELAACDFEASIED
jgi:hypothetical protein